MSTLVNGTHPLAYTPMAFPPPELARQLTIQIYAGIASFAVLLWDIIIHVPDEYKLFTKYRITPMSIVHVISRLTTFTWVLCLVVMKTIPMADCGLLRHVSLIFPFILPLTILPLAVRVCCLYNKNKYVVTLFSFLWLTVLATSIGMPFAFRGYRIGDSQYCGLKMVPGFIMDAHAICPLINDIIIFAATSWALMRFSYPKISFGSGLKHMVFGKHLFVLSKSMLRNGQAYFLSAIVFHIFFVTLCYVGRSFVLPCTFGLPLLVLTNNMACHINRNLHFKAYEENTCTSSAFNRMERACIELDRQQKSAVEIGEMVCGGTSQDQFELGLIRGNDLRISVV